MKTMTTDERANLTLGCLKSADEAAGHAIRWEDATLGWLRAAMLGTIKAFDEAVKLQEAAEAASILSPDPRV